MNGAIHPLSNCNFCPNALLHAAPQTPRERGIEELSHAQQEHGHRNKKYSKTI